MRKRKPYMVKDFYETVTGDILGYYDTLEQAVDRINQQVDDTDGECDCEIYSIGYGGYYYRIGYRV